SSEAGIARRVLRQVTNVKEKLYLARSRTWPGKLYSHAPGCQSCDAKDICDSLHGDYADMFGEEGVRPLRLGFRVKDPTDYIRQQQKIVEGEDESWSLPVGTRKG